MEQHANSETNVKVVVTCPYCGSTRTELSALFGPQLLTVEYYCNSCHTPFEHVKDDDVLKLAFMNERKNNNDHDK